MKESKELIAEYVECARSRTGSFPKIKPGSDLMQVADELDKIKAVIEDERSKLIVFVKTKYYKKWSLAQKEDFTNEQKKQFQELYLSVGKRVIPPDFLQPG
ncbi:MAG: hypothetical protein ACO1O6_01660 [Bacteroidota bacterium]